jgi:hypothetical protein
MDRVRSSPLRVLARLLVAVVLGLTLAGLTSSAAIAVGSNCGSTWGYHYAGIFTSTVGGRTECAASIPEYLGWNGVYGRVTAPSGAGLTLHDYTVNHTAGWIGMQFNHSGCQDCYWMQGGWYTGTISGGSCPVYCVQRNGTYGLYVENNKPGGYYSVSDFGTIAASSAHSFQVSYNSSTGCWESYEDGLKTGSTDCSEGVSGAGMVAAEMLSSNNYPNPLPVCYFGASSSSSAAALHLHGANGWASWNTSLLAGTTQAFDERDYTPGYEVSAFNNYWYFEAYKNR